MNLDQFTNESLAQISVSKYINQPGKNSWKDGGFLGECVSEVNQYCWRVLGVPAGVWGHAAAWANDTNPNRQYLDKVGSIQAGDILVYPTMSAPFGHIEIALPDNLALGQNGRKASRVAVGARYPNPVILRKKGGSPPNQGGTVVVDQNYLNNLYLATFGRKPDPSAQGFIGQPGDVVLQALLDAPEETAFEAKARLEKTVKSLQDQLANSNGDNFVAAGQLYVKK